jgi:hypothetical protein
MRRPRPVSCACSLNLTCRACLAEAPPYFFTLDSGVRVYGADALAMAEAAEQATRPRPSHPSAD